ncbi:NAD-dependent epimerase/dehydratase family protein [Engelhardtia mirabilis]|uniref:dTDP-4-oxo-6-deoxy-D-allose reductase n=1 Tax=Engelhardtia mirabilis TaxID=2528011 RepID=A0A518BJI5_9BACT|nr:dTDP-4-oxo-6-deoxy-D-allose reductase [Planctomycetes bacterium Pla133]QDV01463.1 dTDP-4-oxo-6-deoxy-D-allose reductase [Planctomycetes bacterium Pla86]
MKAASKRTALVAGGGGFIGGHLAKTLLERGFSKVRCVDVKPFDQWYQFHDGAENRVLDLRDIDACRQAVDGVDEVFNLAADMGGMGFIENNKALCMISVLINTHLLMAAEESGCERYFYASSACVYNGDKQQEADVTALKEADAYPALAEDGYGWEKLFSERMCRHFREDYGIETRVARFHNVYGPNGTFDGGREKAPAAMCRKVIEAQLAGTGEMDIWGDGEQTRSFMYIDDCVEGILKIHEGKFTDPINLGSSELVSINQLVDIVEDIAGIQLDRKYDLSAPKGVRGRNSDNSLILREFGWEPNTSLREGMAKTYAWIYDEIVSRYGAALPKARAATAAAQVEGSAA